MNELIARLDRIFEGLLGCRVDFAPLENLSREEWNDSDLTTYTLETAEATSCIRDISSQRLGFPIRRAGRFAGLAVVSNWKSADHDRLFDMAEFMTALLERELSASDQINLLRETEERLEVERGHDNVVRLRPRAPITELRSSRAEEPPSATVVPPLLVQYKAGFPFQRVAFETHSRTDRWAFLSLKDLPGDVFDSVESFTQVGAITLFIEDLTVVDMETQQKIAGYLSALPIVEIPLIIAGITETPETLIAQGLLHPDLVACLAFTRLTWNPQDGDRQVITASVRLLVDGQSQRRTQDGRFVPFHANYLDLEDPTVH